MIAASSDIEYSSLGFPIFNGPKNGPKKMLSLSYSINNALIMH